MTTDRRQSGSESAPDLAEIRLWGGKGSGAPCNYCGRRITASEIEYEVEAEVRGRPVTLHFHPACHEAWKAQSEKTR